MGVKSYEDLVVYQKGYDLALKVHQLTRAFPEFERRELGYQLRRAAVSVPANIAEGYGRKDSSAEFKHFLRTALGSCNETQVLLRMACDLGYTGDEGKQVVAEYDVLGKQLYQLISRWGKISHL